LIRSTPDRKPGSTNEEDSGFKQIQRTIGSYFSHSAFCRQLHHARFSLSKNPFHLEEATITDIQNAIKGGQISCRGVVQAYIDRAKAYNGTCTALVTKDGTPIPPATGTVRAGSPLKFPTQTVPVSSIFPNYDKYAEPPMELGRMEPTISDPTVQQQFGMRVGVPNAGQLNALETLNIRGERSVTCGPRATRSLHQAPCRNPVRLPANPSASNPTLWSAPPNWISNSVKIRISQSSRCTAW
jgi:hypothetical protein